MIKPRYKRFLEELPLNKNKILPSALKAGYSPSYADKQGKILLNNAIKQSARDILQQTENKELSTPEAKRLMCELLGLSREEVFNQLKRIAIQEKDYSSALKVLSPLSKELGVDISNQEDTNITVPILNIGVRNTPENGLNKGDNNSEV